MRREGRATGLARWLRSRSNKEEDVANWVRRNDDYAESLAKHLQDGLDKTLEALRERRQRISEMKAAAERIAKALS